MNRLGGSLEDLPIWLAAHVELTILALGIGLVISLPAGILASRHERLGTLVLGVASILQTIPGLALLALMVPLLGALGPIVEDLGGPSIPSIGFLPAVLALSLYSLLPILRNTVTGLAAIDPALRESAMGVGMSPRESLLRVELPIAMPTIVAGIRTATVWVVGTATLATPVGGASLGNPIFAGLQTRNLSAVLGGSLAAAGLAIVLDGLIRLIEQGLGPSRAPARRLRLWLGLAGLFVLVSGAIAGRMSPNAETGAGSQGHATIGAKAFTEQYILSEILAGAVMEAGARRVERVPSLGSTVAFDALVAGDLDLYVDYSGTIWATILGEGTIGVDRGVVLDEVRRRLRDEYGIEVLTSLGFENTYALAMLEDRAEALAFERISDLAPLAPELEILGDFEFFERPEWAAIESSYGLRFRAERAMDSSLMYEALRSGQGDVVSAYSTDGRIAAYGLRVLEDDRRVIPPYDAVVLASAKFLRREPALVRALRALEGRLSAAEMRRLNAAVDLAGRSPAAVANDWWRVCSSAKRDHGGEASGRPCGWEPDGPPADP